MESSRSSDSSAQPTGLDGALVAFGNLVFRCRNGLAPVLLAIVLLLTRPHQFGGSARTDAVWDLAGVLVALAGQALRILVIGLAYIQRGGKNRTIAADKLVVDGIFAHARHPLYVGNFLLLTGLMMIWNSPGGYAMLALAGLALFSMARAEELFLSRKFGPAFDEYCARVPRFIPNLRGLGATLSRFSFDWKRVVRKEYGTTFSCGTIAIVLIVMEHVEWEGFRGAGATVMTGAIVWLALAGLWGVARWMKKSRRLKSPD